jgi:hypothetical protein
LEVELFQQIFHGGLNHRDQFSSSSSLLARIAASGCNPDYRVAVEMKNWHWQPHVLSIECKPSTDC